MALATLATIEDVVARINAKFSAEKPAGGFADATTLAGVKAITDASTAVATAGAVARRDANGDAAFRELTVSQDPSGANALSRKSWVDTQVASRLATSLLGAASGVASLDSGGKIPTSQLPPLAINETFVAASQAAMLALTAQRGDMARRTDLTPNRIFVLAADDPTILANWVEINAAGAVTSVDGQTGTVSLGSTTSGASTLARRTSTGQLVAADAVAASELTTLTQQTSAISAAVSPLATSASVAEVKSQAFTTTASITSTNRPASPVAGVRYKESDTGDIVAWTGTRWQKVGGLPRSVASNPNSGGTGNIGATAGAGAVLAARSLAIPAHVPGTLRVQYTGLWYAAAGQALWGHLRMGSSFASAPEIESTRMRSHNNGLANASTSLHCEGHWNSDGSATTIWLATYVEAVTTTAMIDGAFRVWVEGQEL